MHSQETLVAFGGALRALGDGKVGGYLVPFTSEEEKDLYGTYFTPNTYYGKRCGDGMDVLMHHGIPIRAEVNGQFVEFSEFAKRPFKNPMRTTVDDNGVFAEVLLDMADEYEAMIYDLVSHGVLKWSSGALAHTLDVDPTTGEVRTWMIGEGSLTPTPGTPFNRTLITPLRSLLSETPPMTTATEQTPQNTDAITNAEQTAEAPAGTAADPIRATLLGDYLEPRLTMDALSTIHYALYWRVESIMYTEGITAEEAVERARPYFDEYLTLALFTIGAIMRGSAGQTPTQAVESIRGMYPRGDVGEFLRASQVLSAKNLGLLKEARDRIDTVIAAQEGGASRSADLPAPTEEEAADTAGAADPPPPVRVDPTFLNWLITTPDSATPDSATADSSAD